MAASKSGKDKGAMAFFVVALLLTLVGAGAGLSVGALLHPEPADLAAAPAPETQAETPEPTAADGHGLPKDAHAAASADAPEAATIAPEDVKAVPFPPVLTTLAAPKGKWIRVEGSILAALETEEAPELLAEKAGEQIFNYLHSVRLDQIEGPSGVLGLTDDLNEMLEVLSNGQVKGVLIHGLVVE